MGLWESKSILTSVPLGKGCDITLSQAVYSKLLSEIGFSSLNVQSYMATKCGCKELCQCESAVVAVMFEHVEAKKSIVGEYYLDIQVSHLKVTKKTNSLFVVNVDKIATAVVTVSFNDNEQMQYLCDVPNMMESD